MVSLRTTEQSSTMVAYGIYSCPPFFKAGWRTYVSNPTAQYVALAEKAVVREQAYLLMVVAARTHADIRIGLSEKKQQFGIFSKSDTVPGLELDLEIAIGDARRTLDGILSSQNQQGLFSLS